MAVTCPTCGADLVSLGSPCPSCGAPEVEALLAKALEELRALPSEKVRQVLQAATALAGAATRTVEGSATVVVSVVDTATVVDSASGVVVGPELPPATGSLLKLATKENVALVAAVISLVNTCAGLLRERGRSPAGNITIVQPAPTSAPPAPPPQSAPKAPGGSPKPGEPPPLLKRPVE